MTLQQLKYVIEVADRGSITEAAKSLFIAQPSLSAAIRELEEEVKRLVAVQVSNHPLVTLLRENPHYLNDNEWQSLFTLTNELYNNFTTRLQARFPQITPTEMRLCVLLKLRFGHTQIADMQAISPASLSQIKSRLKRKLQQTSPNLFGQEHTLDTFLIDF